MGSFSVKINGKDLRDFGFRPNAGLPEGLFLPPIKRRDLELPLEHGVRDYGSLYGERTIRIEGEIWAKSVDDLWEKINALKRFLQLPSNVKEWELCGSAETGYGVVRAMKLQFGTEPDRYWLVNYAGESSLRTVTRHWVVDKRAIVSITFRAAYPFAVSDPIFQDFGEVRENTFLSIEDLGTHYSSPIWYLEGFSSEPELIIAKTALICHFNSNPKAINIRGLEEDGNHASLLRFHGGTRVGLGIFGRPDGTKGDVVKFASMFDEGSVPSAYPTGVADRFNRNQGTILIDFTPNWNFDDGKTHILVECGWLVVYKRAEGYWRFFINGAGLNYTPENPSEFRAGQTYRIICTWDAKAPYRCMFVGSVLDSNPEASDTTAHTVSSPTSDIQIGLGAAGSLADKYPADATIHRIVIWDIPLDPTEDIEAKLSTPDTDPSTVHPEHIIAGFDFTDETAGDVAIGYQEGDWALEFDGSDDYIQSQNSVSFTEGLTFEALVRPNFDKTETVTHGIIHWYNGADHVALGYHDDDASWRFLANNQGVWKRVYDASKTVNKGQWHHLVGILKADGTLLLYLNGELAGSEVGASLPSATADILVIGDWFTTGNARWYGSMTYVRAYTRPLNENEVKQLYAGLDPKDVLPDYDEVCVLDYRFDEETHFQYNDSTGNAEVIDQSPQGNNGTLVGFTYDGSDTPSSTSYVPDQLWRAFVGFKGYCAQRTELVDAPSGVAKTGTWDDAGTTRYWVRVGSAEGFEPGDLVSLWNDDTDNPRKLITTVRKREYDEDNDRYIVYLDTETDITAWTGNLFLSKNLLANPDFEASSTQLVHWSAQSNVTASVDSTNVLTNSNCALCEKADVTGDYGIYQSLSVGTGKRLTARAWVNHNATATYAHLQLDDGVQPITVFATKSNEWELLEATIETQASGLTIRLTNYGASSISRWDALQLFENKVANPGFEDDLTGWSVASGVSASQSTTQKHSGNASCSVSRDEWGVTIQTSSAIIPANDGKWYEVSAWLYVESGSLFIALRKTSDGSRVAWTEPVSETGWTRVSLVYKNTSDSSLTFAVYAGAGGGSGYVDDVTVRPIYDVPLQIEPMPEGYHYLPAKQGMGLLIDSGDILYYNAPLNKSEFGFLVRLRPQFPSSIGSDAENKYIFDAYYDEANRYALYYDTASDLWVFEIVSNNVSYKLTAAQNFNPDDEIELSGWFFSNGRTIDGVTYYAKLFINGQEAADFQTSIPALAGNPSRIYIGSNRNGYDQAQSIFDEFVAFVEAPTDDDLIAYFTAQEEIECENLRFVYNGTLNQNEILKIDVPTKKVKLYRPDSGRETNVLAYCSGDFPVIGDTRSVIYVPKSIKRLSCRYRKEWL